jgi:catechol 2,3-dioxygenase
MTTLPLNVNDLLDELEGQRAADFDGLPSGTVMGHIHLKVADIPETVAFYRDVLGLALMARLGSQAAFLSAGGYHHHIGANTWESMGAPPPPQGTAALRQATIVLPSRKELDRVLGRLAASGQVPSEDAAEPIVRDPSGNALVLATA